MILRMAIFFAAFIPTTFVFAQEGAPPAKPEMGMAGFLPFILMFAVFYFLMIRPQQKKMKAQQEMINSLQKGAEVVTQSGIFGKITGLTDKVVTLEIANNVRVKILKSQISSEVKPEQLAN